MPENFVNINRVIQKLNRLDLSGPQEKKVLVKAARHGGNVIKDEVRRQVPTKGNWKYIFHIRKSIKVRTSRSRKNPGVNVYAKGAKVPFGDEFWNIQGYEAIYYGGNYRTRPRRTRRGKKRGNISDHKILNHNPYGRAVKNKGRTALTVMAGAIKKEVVKTWGR